MQKEKIINVFFLITSTILFSIGLYSIYSNIANEFCFINLVNIIGNVVVMVAFIYSYYQYFKLKNYYKFKFFITIPLTVYMLTMIICSTYYNHIILVSLGFCLVLFCLLESKVYTKLLYALSVVLIYLIMMGLQILGILPMIIDEITQDRLYTLASTIVGTFIFIGLLVGIVIISSQQSYHENTLDGILKQFCLTQREIQTAQAIYQYQNKKIEFIAKEKLCIAHVTAKSHLSHIYKKMGVKSRYEMVEKIKSIKKN